jgi:hypothetical protein
MLSKPLRTNLTIGNITVAVICFIVVFLVAYTYVSDVGVVSAHAKPPITRSEGKLPKKGNNAPPDYETDNEVVIFETDHGVSALFDAWFLK